MTSDLYLVILGIFLYLVVAGAVSLRFEAEYEFPTPLSMLVGLLWVAAIPFFIGVEISAHLFQPPDRGESA